MKPPAKLYISTTITIFFFISAGLCLKSFFQYTIETETIKQLESQKGIISQQLRDVQSKQAVLDKTAKFVHELLPMGVTPEGWTPLSVSVEKELLFSELPPIITQCRQAAGYYFSPKHFSVTLKSEDEKSSTTKAISTSKKKETGDSDIAIQADLSLKLSGQFYVKKE